MSIRRFSSLTIPFLMAASAISCNTLPGNDPGEVAGDYHATTFTGTRGTTVLDYITVGGSVNVHLASDGTMTGTLSIPPTAQLGNGTSFSLAGTWTLDDPIVEMTVNASTWFSQIDWTLSFNALDGTNVSFGDIAVHIALAK